MNKTELYTEFREKRTEKVTVEKAGLRRKLRKINNGVILEYNNEKYQLYYSSDVLSGNGYEQNNLYHLEIDPAARIRFEGSLDEYEALLKEIKTENAENYNLKIYTKLQDGNVDNDFFIMDIYYQMK